MSDDYKPVLRSGSDPLVFLKYPDSEGASSITRGHIMAAAMSRALRDGDVVFMGANLLLPMAATCLAQLTHAPNLTFFAGASGGVNSLVEPLAPSSGDYAYLIAEAVVSFADVLMLQMSGHSDVFFAGGIQIDRRGNCNLARVGSAERTTFRGPGSAGLPWGANSRRRILYTTTHDTRLFVPKVDFVSLPGWPEGRSTGDEYGPVLVVTPLAVMDFAPSGDMKLVSFHSGVTVDEVVTNTGFELIMPEGQVPTTREPSEREMELMRGFDLDGLLSIVV
jgi:glutaconate CoA-transferase, subunit B